MTTTRRTSRSIPAETWAAAAAFGIVAFVALMLPLYFGDCRPGWFRYGWHEAGGSPPHFFCGRPPPADDWGYFPHSLITLKIAIGVGGAFLARAIVLGARRRRVAAAAMVTTAVLGIGLVAAVVLHPTVEERTGRLAATLRCLDPGCEGMNVEEAVMSEDSFRARFPQARRAWRFAWNGLYGRGLTADTIRQRLAEKYGEEILVR